jgi:hypothetical protein
VWVAVSSNGTDQVMRSTDGGVNWDPIEEAAANQWQSVSYGDGLWVAVAKTTGTGNRVMTSPDGENWTARASAADNDWESVAYGNGLWVAVASSGAGDRVMTSPDGITWTLRVSAADNGWTSVAYGNGLWVAVANSGAGDRVMTSPDGITWTLRVSAADNMWASVAYGNGVWVAVGITGVGNRVMTSPDGITWTSVDPSSSDSIGANSMWMSVAYGNGVWVAVSASFDQVMRSSDNGSTWTGVTGAEANGWQSVAYGNGVWVAVSSTGGNRVMRAVDPIAGACTFTTARANIPVGFAGGQEATSIHVVGSRVYAGTAGGLATSTDGGLTFTVSVVGLGGTIVPDVYAVGSTVYVGTNGGVSISPDGGATWTNSTSGLGSAMVRAVYAVGSTVYAATDGGLSISTDGGANFTNRTTAQGLGGNVVLDVYALGSTVYAATGGGLSISTDGGATFVNRIVADGLPSATLRSVYVVGGDVYAGTLGGLGISTNGGENFISRTTANGLGNNDVNDVFVVGNAVYLATQDGISISSSCGTIASDSSDSSDSGGGTDPGIFLNVAGPMGESAPETPIYYGGSNLPGGSQYVLTLSDVCSPSRVIATLAEGTIGVQGSLSSFTRPPARSPGTYNVRLVVTHSNGLAWQLQSQVTIGASGEYTSISAPVGSHSAAVASPPSSAGCAAVSSPTSASASTPTPAPVASAGQCTTSGFGSYVQQADAKPEVLFPSGEKIQLAPGKTLGSSGGDLVNLDVELLEDNAVFEGHCYEVNVASTVVGGENPGSQTVVTLTGAGEIGERFLTLTSGELTGVTGSGFRPGTRVDIFLLSEPILLGSVVVYAEGDFSAQVSFIAGRVPSGSHTLQIQGVGYDGVVKIVNTGVWVENTSVVVPEGSVTWWWWLLIAALVIMFIIIFVRRRHNREAIY